MKINSLIVKYKNSSVVAKATFWYMFCNVIQKAVTFLVTPIFTRIMSTNDFGVYSVYNSWYWLVSVFATLNLSLGAFNVGMKDYADKRDYYTSSIQGLSSIITIGLFVIYIPFKEVVYSVTGLTELLVILMFLECLMSPALSFWMGRQRYEYRYKAMVVVTITIAVVRPVFSAIVVILAENKGIARVGSYVAFQVAVGMIAYIYNWIKGKKFFDISIWKSGLFFSIPLIPHYLSQTLLAHCDKIMIDRYCGKSEVGIYQLAYSIAMVSTIVNTSITNSIIPWVHSKLKIKEAKAIRSISMKLLTGVAVLNLLIIVFAKEAVFILGGKGYGEAIYVLPPLIWSVFFMFVYNVFGNVEFYYKKTKYTMYGSLTGCVVNVVLNMIFIPLCGYYAAAYTTLIGYIISAIMHYYFIRKIEKSEKLDSLCNYKALFLISCIGSIVMFGIQFTYQIDWIRYAVIFICFVLASIFRKRIISLIGEVLKLKNNR